MMSTEHAKTTDDGHMTETTSDPHRARVAAIRLASSRMKRMQTDLDAARKRWKDKLTDATQEFNALIPESEADLPDDAQMRLVDIVLARKKQKDLESEKKKEIDKLAKRQERAKARFWELVDSEVEDPQISMALGEASLGDGGLGVSNEAAREVFLEIREMERLGGRLDPDTEDLKRRLEAQGFADLTLDEEDDESESDDEPEEHPPMSVVK